MEEKRYERLYGYSYRTGSEQSVNLQADVLEWEELPQICRSLQVNTDRVFDCSGR